MRDCLRARWTVTPAHSRGAACSEARLPGILATWVAGAFTNSAYPPSTVTPVICCCTQRFSLPSRQNSHFPQVQWIQGTPTLSPTFTPCTSEPASTIVPATSCPRISGFLTIPANCGQSPSATCKSEWHTPQTSTL